jgi:hypothetical protein
MLSTGRCRSCRKPIRWALTEKGRRMPLDPDPYEGDDPRGLFVLRSGDAGPVAVAAPADAFPEEPHYRTHFATCPNATRHRRAR